MDLAELVAYLEKHKLRTMQVTLSADNPGQVESNAGGGYTDVAGKTWPCNKNGPMRNLLHIKVDELPHIPQRVADLAYITFFIDRDYVEYGIVAAESANVVVRTVPRSTSTVRIQASAGPTCKFAKFTSRDDYPDLDDVLFYLENDQIECSHELISEACGLRPTVDGVKINGYPPTIQGHSGGPYENDNLGLIISGEKRGSKDFSLPFGDCPVFQIGWSEFHNGWYSSWDTY